MLIGCCVSTPERAAAARAAGIDFIEVGLSGLMSLEDATFAAWRAAIGAEGVPVYAANGFMPADLKVVGPAVDDAKVRDYVARAGERLESLGAKVAVFGSSGSRHVPDGFDPGRAREQLAAFLAATASELGRHGISVAVEPLRPEESNLINTVEEGLALVRDGGSGARVLADFFHMREQGESLDILEAAGDLLAHTHVSSHDRRGPTGADSDARAFVGRLRDIGYAGGCSMECGWDDFATEVGGSVSLLRQWAAA